MKFTPIFALSLLAVATAAPVAIESPELVAKDAATYSTYGTPPGGYGSYPPPPGGYETYPTPPGGYKTYPAPSGGYKTYGRAIGDMIKRLWA